MSGHTNRNKRNGGNPRSRHGPQRQRGADDRAGQPRNGAPRPPQRPAPGDEQPLDAEQRGATGMPRPPDPIAAQSPDASSDAADAGETAQPPARDEVSASDEQTAPPERPEGTNPRGRMPFAAGARGSHAYIPASGPANGPANGAHANPNGSTDPYGYHNGRSAPGGRNGHHNASGNVAGRLAEERLSEPVFAAGDEDETSGGPIPWNWRVERLNGGVDQTPREPFRPESRGEVGSLIDALRELFAEDRSVASRGDSARCGICYLHFPLSALEYREAEGFYVCAGCKRSLGHQQVMMIRRQQSSHGG